MTSDWTINPQSETDAPEAAAIPGSIRAPQNLGGSVPLRLPNDYALMESIAAGDETALEQLYDRYSNLVFTLAVRVLRDRSDAEDLLIDVFFELWRRAERFDASRGTPLTYLMTIARSRAIDRHRLAPKPVLKGDAAAVAIEAQDALAASNAASSDGDAPLHDAIVGERRQIMLRALAQLDPDQRLAVEYSFYDGLSHSEIAERMGRPLGTVKTWIRQGLIRLRDLLRNH